MTSECTDDERRLLDILKVDGVGGNSGLEEAWRSPRRPCVTISFPTEDLRSEFMGLLMYGERRARESFLDSEGTTIKTGDTLVDFNDQFIGTCEGFGWDADGNQLVKIRNDPRGRPVLWLGAAVVTVKP